MLMTTTALIEGRTISRYHGVVTGEAIIGANIFRDLFASIRNIVGGRSGAYEHALADARKATMEDMQAHDGSMWLATSQGLYHFRKGRFTRYDRSRGLAPRSYLPALRPDALQGARLALLTSVMGEDAVHAPVNPSCRRPWSRCVASGPSWCR